MTSLAVSNTFTTGTIDAPQFNTNYSDIATYINNRNSASVSWDGMSISSATNVPVTTNNSSGTQDIAQFLDNGSVVGEIFDGGIISWPLQDYGFCSGSAFIIGAGTSAKWAVGGTDLTLEAQTHSNMDATAKFTCASNGKYLITFTCRATTSGNVAGTVGILLYKNGAQISSSFGNAGVSIPSTTSQTVLFLDIASLTLNDYLEIYINNPGTHTITLGGLGGNYWTVSKIA